MKNLFERIYSRTRATEDLTTEILAFLLDQEEAFRHAFLRRLGVDGVNGEPWEIESQRSLRAPGEDFHGKRPDLWLYSESLSCLVLLEVQIDAGPTYGRTREGDLVPQTEFYQRFLKEDLRRGTIKEGILATLTRWKPPHELAIDSHLQLRFSDLVEILRQQVR